MVDSEVRTIMAELNRFPDHRDASGSGGPQWKHPATIIKIPKNPPPQGRTFSDDAATRVSKQSSGRQSGTNPFNTPGVGAKKNKKNTVGNQTSSRTIIGTMRADTFGPTSGNRYYPKSVPTNRDVMHGKPRQSNEIPEQEVIHVEDDDDSSIPEQVAGVKRPYQGSPSSDDLNIKSRESVSPSDLSSKYPFSKTINKSTQQERKPGLAPDGEHTIMVDEKYGDQAESDPIEEYPEPQRPETRGHVRRIIQKIENSAASEITGPKVDLNAKLKNKKSKNMKPNGQSRNQLKFNPGPQLIDVDSEPSKHEFKIQDPIATGTTLQKTEQQGMPLKRVCIEDIEISGESLRAFSSLAAPLFIKHGNEELFNLSSWPMKSLDMEYTAGDDPTIQIKYHVNNSSTRILTIQFLVKNDPTGRYDKLFTHLKKTIPKTGIVRDDKILWQLAEMHRDQTATESSSNAKGKEPQFKKQKLSPSDVQPKHPSYPPSDRYRSRTSDLRDEGSERQASRSTSKSRSNPPPPQAGGIVALRRSTRNAPPEKPVDQDKVILVYPQGIPGAVTITNGDLARLQPGEYLNDTLIEFGLKLWLRQLEEKQPELATQVHIFNSFFYKKLNNKKNEVQAFETVRKWTSKFDIFQKKYIIVPINEHMHWYLAIIYQPQYILLSTAPDETPTRKRTRLSVKVDPEETVSISAPEPEDIVFSARSPTSSEKEVERNLDTNFQSSCTIDAAIDDINTQKTETKREDDATSDDLSYVTDPNDLASRPQPPVDHTPLDNPKEATLDSMDVDEIIEIQSENRDDNTITEVPAASTSKSVLEGSSTLRSIPPSTFYGKSAKSKGKQKAEAQADPMDIDVEAQNKTYIFTFDSLGTNHPHAAKKLAQYLRMEAKDKKGIPNAGFATGKTAFVPVQPNFCDCGVYLIHFAQTFLTNPKKYFDLIMSQSKSISNQEKQEQWNDKQVADMRAELSARIQDLSAVWLKERALKEEEARAQQGSKDPDHINVVNSDDDIEIPSPVKKSGRAARIRG